MRIYLDHNATTPISPHVAGVIARVTSHVFGNPSSVHYFGQQAKAIIDDARANVAALVGAEASEVVFTSGGTEADNLAIRGVAETAVAGRRHVVTSGIEHEAVLNTIKSLERHGWRITILPVPATGVVGPEAVAGVVTRETALVSIMHANNEVGTIQPIADLAAIARGAGAVFHTDAVQSVGKIPVDVRELGVDLLSLSAHKFNGPKGVGALWIRRGVRLVSTMTGGRHERNRRAGTENVAGIAGCGAAAALAHDKPTATGEIARLRDRLERGILAGVPETRVNGDVDRRVPNTSNISFEGVEAESLLIALDLEGIAVSTGSACSSGTLEPSHVLRAMGLSMSRARNSLRFSVGLGNTDAEIDRVIERVPALVGKLRRLSRTAAALR